MNMSENVLSDKELIAELRAENAELRRQLQEVTDKLNLALQMIEKLTVKKNSKNSKNKERKISIILFLLASILISVSSVLP